MQYPRVMQHSSAHRRHGSADFKPEPCGYLVGTPKGDRLVVVGQGYAGLPVAIRAVEAGFDVVGFDVDVGRIKRLAAGESHVEDVTRTRSLAPSPPDATSPPTTLDERRGFDVAVIDVPTPLTDGAPNLSHVTDAASHARRVTSVPGATVILESTTYPGTTEGAGGRHPRGWIRAGGGARLPPRLQPGADRPRKRHLALHQYAEGGLGRRQGVVGGRARRSSIGWSNAPCPFPAPGRPSSPSCWRTPSAT